MTLRLVDPSFYHLDTAVAVLDATPGQEHIAYLPSAFDAASPRRCCRSATPMRSS